MRAFQKSRLVLIVTATAVILGVVAVFFEAPVVPVTFNGNRPRRGGPNGSGECTVLVCGWTEWESPGYRLLNLGYHYRITNNISNCYG